MQVRMPIATLTTKGQVTVPKPIRDKLGLKTGSRLDFQIEPSGKVVLRPLNSDFRSLRGIVRSKHKRPVSLRAMDDAIAAGSSKL